MEVAIMELVEKEALKLHDSLGKITGAESNRLQGLLEDFGQHGSQLS